MHALRRTILVVRTATLLPIGAFAAGSVSLDARGVAIHSHDPVAYFVDGKLYLNLSPAVQKRRAEDIPGHISRANQNWALLKNQ